MIVDRQADRRLIERVGRLGRHWRVIAGAGSVCAAAALLVSLWLPDVYRATTYVLVSDSKFGEGGDANLQQMAMLATFVPFVDNDSLIAESLRKLSLDAPPHELTVDRFRRGKHIDVRVIRSTRLLEINIEFTDPELAARLANDLAEGAVRFNDRLNQADTIASRTFLKQNFEDASQRFADAAEHRRALLEAAQIEARESEIETLLAERDDLHVRLQELRLESTRNRARSEALSQALATEPEIIYLTKSIEAAPLLETAIEKEEREETPLAVIEESLNPVREQMRMDFVAATVEASVQSAGIQAATARLDAVDRDVAEKLRLLISTRSRIAAADQEYAMASAAVEEASRQYEAASLVVTSKSQDLRQIAPAITPEQPVRPRLALNVILGFVLGVLTSGGAAAVIESCRDFRERTGPWGNGDPSSGTAL